ncbi:MAG TPA: hypothetical protein VHR36_07860 [Pyrinomonadaceae bacterium]|jgi:hypothetical protein|nr:hypothetical protein [Pyrinomonadaceae bacterium]
MFLLRAIVLVLLLTTLSGSAPAQRPGPEFRRPLACEPAEPRTKLEAIESRVEEVLIKGFTQVAGFNVRGADIRVDAVEIKEARAGGERALGLVIVLREQGDEPRENRAFVDYEEIDRVLRALELVTKVNESASKLVGFEARYRTVGDLEFRVFRQSRASGTAASLTAGICDRVTGLLTLDEMDRLKAHIVEAKARLDEIK